MRDRKSTREYGQDLIEYAIIFPILFLLLAGIFDLGRVVYYYSSLTNAAREGARWGVIHPDPDDNPDIAAIICNYSVGLDLGCPNPAMNVEWLDEDGNVIPQDWSIRPIDIRVLVSYQFQPVTPIMGFFLGLGLGDDLTLNGQATMRIEH